MLTRSEGFAETDLDFVETVCITFDSLVDFCFESTWSASFVFEAFSSKLEFVSDIEVFGAEEAAGECVESPQPTIAIREKEIAKRKVKGRMSTPNLTENVHSKRDQWFLSKG